MSLLYYNIKYGFKALFRFFKVIWEFRAWDYTFTERILKICLEEHLHNIKYYSNEIEKDRLVKITKLERAIELLDNKIKDDYADRCGYDFDYEFDFLPCKNSTFGELVTNQTEEQKEKNTKAIFESQLLADKEWQEFTDILRTNWNGWWS